MSETYEYRTRTNGEVEIIRGGSLVRLLSAAEADDFLKQVETEDREQVMERFADERPDRKAGSQDQGHPVNKDPLPGPTPHGDGTVREKDGEEKPSE